MIIMGVEGFDGSFIAALILSDTCNRDINIFIDIKKHN